MSRSGFLLASTFAALALTAACSEKAPPPPEQKPAAAPAAPPAEPVAPDSFVARFETSKGTFDVQLIRAWAPIGVDRFHTLIMANYFNDERFFRVMPGFVAQFGMSGDPALTAKWASKMIADDPTVTPNKRGTIVFASMMQPGTRSNQFFINLADNAMLDAQFPPIGHVMGDGMKVVDAIYSGYGDGPPGGTGPDQGQITTKGNAYLTQAFPKLDYIKNVALVPAAKK